MSKKKSPKPEILKPTSSELKTVREILVPFYRQYEDRLGDKSMDEKIDGIIESAKIGYPYCPKTFLSRVKRIAKISPGDMADGKTGVGSYYNHRETVVQNVLANKEQKLQPGKIAKELRDVLPPSERRKWAERELYYKQEFNFNDSSDWPLLLQVLIEEITQFRLMKKRLEDSELNVDRALDSSNKRMINALKALGITREQREAGLNESEGNVAQLSLILEEKLHRIEAIAERDEAEERALELQRNTPEFLNKIPAALKDVVERAMESKDY